MRRPPRRARQHLVPTPRARAYALKLTSPPPPSRLSSHSFRSAQVVLVNVAARRPDWPVSTIILEHGLGSRAPTTTSAFNYDPRSIAGLFALDASISTPPPPLPAGHLGFQNSPSRHGHQGHCSRSTPSPRHPYLPAAPRAELRRPPSSARMGRGVSAICVVVKRAGRAK